ncbi:hypothetical protein J5U18_12730 [Sphingobacteriaceae bacterium WQ 2009]|uniref:Terminase n=1 Tax=Rhinopithecimicrobium faecis TaxID=2820698 RepID=A0A8T4HE51_9SPHI|nr:hypothetical protein [Sphingobacteriaceae bacterium WQ 2009]
MAWRPKIKTDNGNVSVQFSHWLAQMLALIMPKILNLILGRGSAKTTEIIAARLIEMAYDMPGAPIVWVSDTYSNLQKNVLPSILEGLERKGFKEGIHFVLGKQPPVYSEVEKEDLPNDIREHFWKPYNKLATYKHTMVWFTGLNITFGSLDRPASLAGRSYVHVIGDEVKYFPEHKISNLLKAIRGYKVKYGNSVFYRGQTFTTDMPNPGNIGEHDWIVKQAGRMDKDGIMLALKTGLVMNEAKHEWIYQEQRGDREEAVKKRRTFERWNERWIEVRQHKSAQMLFFTASSYVNADILTNEWFEDQIDSDLGDTDTAVLSLKPKLASGERFYANIGEAHFYDDGLDPIWSERFGITDLPDCRELKYLNRNKSIDLGVDFGKMMSMSIAQDNIKDYRILKFMYVLSPDWIRELADNFLEYFKPQKEKKINLYYDRAGNNYKDAGQDYATALKNALEHLADGKTKTGWKVTLMSLNQGNIGQNEEYNFMQELLGNNNRRLPKVLIDKFQCKPLKESLQNAKTKVINARKGGKSTVKDKSSEHLPLKRLPLESTNPSDSFKYLMMRKQWRNLVKYTVATLNLGDTSVR